jgi:hypothetical protein
LQKKTKQTKKKQKKQKTKKTQAAASFRGENAAAAADAVRRRK